MSLDGDSGPIPWLEDKPIRLRPYGPLTTSRERYEYLRSQKKMVAELIRDHLKIVSWGSPRDDVYIKSAMDFIRHISAAIRRYRAQERYVELHVRRQRVECKREALKLKLGRYWYPIDFPLGPPLGSA